MKRKVFLPVLLMIAMILTSMNIMVPASQVQAATTWNNTANVSWIDSSKKIVAFAFDDGPVNGNTATRILDTLEKYQMHATFFYVGNQINNSNKAEIQRAYRLGNEIANHTWTHPYLTNMSSYQIQDEVNKTANQLRSITGASNAKYLVRPPYLATNQTVFNAIDTPLITCSLDSQDWNGASKDTIISRVLNGVQDGSILLMHETYNTTAEAVAYLVPELIKRGYVITSVSELFKMKGKTMTSGQVYTSCSGRNVVNNTNPVTSIAPSSAPVQPNASIQNGTYYIKNVNAQKYLQVKGNTGADGQNVEIGAGTGAAGQKWLVTNTSDGYVTLTSSVGNYMLDIANGADENGANAQIYSAYSGDPQKFQVKLTSTNGVYTIASKGSNGSKVLDVSGRGTADGTNVQLYTSNGQTNQQWIFEAVNQAPAATPSPSVKPSAAPSIAPSVAPSAAPSIAPSVAPSAAPSANPGNTSGTLPAGITCTYKVTGDWGSGYQGEITVTNASGKSYNGWTLGFTLSNSINSLWGADLASQTGSKVTIKSPSWSGAFASGSSVTIGFVATGSSSNAPSGFTFQ
ncbi:polysaccharide deacetylase family protein [[Clostridium] polysaccharolyticum]|uniref:Peptidoglycan/xylan/chitin deacetylase, PgdA/CDA1 family n=1 Tax=[Clostridium] polysaccharolyticum TaxID=29364 RepID=A0A1I0EXV4_9FIRM|nr:polysaccharide deacetylase family protein [[Clostridium] polysaccharolyticum]SET50341.1 Peptidoglycan/xylan/chitin deacetylase, PgdA/CDA1 family [[Clostridium] polysaccharolyticum]